MWKEALQKEAIHLLMLNKVNVNIQTLKENMMNILEDDPIYEDKLFEVTDQILDWQKNASLQSIHSTKTIPRKIPTGRNHSIVRVFWPPSSYKFLGELVRTLS